MSKAMKNQDSKNNSRDSIFDPIYRIDSVSGQIVRKFFTIGQAVKHMLWNKSKLEKLTPAQIQIMLFLNYARKDTITVNTLAGYLSCTPATISGILDVLQKKDLIERTKNDEDRRKVILRLTPKGRAEVEALKDVGKDIEEMVQEFSQKDQELLRKLLVKLADKLAEHDLIVNVDVCAKCAYFQPDQNPRSTKPHYCTLLNVLLSEDDIFKECIDFKALIN